MVIKKELHEYFPSSKEYLNLFFASIAYFFFISIGVLIPITRAFLEFVWLASGVGLAALLISSKKLWPILLSFFFITEFFTCFYLENRTLEYSLVFTTVHICELLICAIFILWKGISFNKFNDLNETLRLVGSAIIVSGITTGLGSILLSSAKGNLFELWRAWYLSDAIGILLITPLVCLAICEFKKTVKIFWGINWLELLAVTSIWVLVSWAIFFNNYDESYLFIRPYWLCVIILWPSVRLKINGTLYFLLFLLIFAFISPSIQYGPSPWPDGTGSLAIRIIYLQAYVLFLSILGFVVSGLYTKLVSTTLKLVEKENKLKHIQLAGNIGLWDWDVINNQIEWSESMYKIFGIDKYTFGGYLPDVLMKAIHPDDLERVEQSRLSVINDGEPTPLEFRIVWSDGSIHHIWSEAKEIIFDELGKVVKLSGVAHDITKQKEYENQLIKAKNDAEKSEEKYRHISNTISDISYSCITNENGNFQLSWIAGAVEKTTGYTISEMMEMGCWAQLILTEDFPIFRENVLNLLPNQSSVCELRLLHKNGNTIWVRSHNECVLKDGITNQHFVYGALINITQYKQSEIALRESESKYKLLADHTNDTVWLMDLNLNITYISPSITKLRGYTLEEIQTLSLEEQLAPDSYKTALTVIQEEIPKALSDKNYKFSRSLELEFYKKDGSTYWSENLFTLIRDENENPIAIMGEGRDITLRKKSEEALKESETKFSTIFENAPIIMSLTELETGKFLDVNKEMLRISGFTRSELIGKTSLEVGWIQAEDRKKLLAILENEKRVNDVEITFWGKGGKAIRCIYQGDVIHLRGKPCLLSISLDISEREQILESLRQKTALLEAELNSSIDGILVVDNNGKKVIQNRRTIELWKIPKEIAENPDDQLQVNHVMNFTKNPQQFVEQVQYLYNHPEETSNDEIELIDGTILDRYSAPVIGSDGVNYGRIWLFRDITDRKITERELEKHRNNLEELVKRRTEQIEIMNDQLIEEIKKKNIIEIKLKESLENQKMLNQLKSRFISTASHEFRTPLTSILSSTELIERYAGKWTKEKIDIHINRIKNSVVNLCKMLDDVIQINRAESGKLVYCPVEINLRKLCQAIIDGLSISQDDKHQLIYNYECERENYSLDQKQIESIVTNLLSNAVKYSPNGGKIELKVSEQEKHLVILVSDEGLGIPSEEIPRLYEPFHRAMNVEDIKGTGLGLSIVKNAVDICNGKISVESQLNVGTIFKVELPIDGKSE